MDPFATLGLARRYDLDELDLTRRYRELQKALHPDRHMTAVASQRRVALGKAVEVNEAYRVLCDKLARAEALLGLLRGGVTPAKNEAADPHLLMEVMELREELSEAKHAKDSVAVAKLSARVQALQSSAYAALTRAFASVSEPAERDALDALASLIARLKYYQRFLDEVRVIEDEAQA